MQMIQSSDLLSGERSSNHNMEVYVSMMRFIPGKCYGPVQVCTHQVLRKDCEQFVAKLFHKLTTLRRWLADSTREGTHLTFGPLRTRATLSRLFRLSPSSVLALSS